MSELTGFLSYGLQCGKHNCRYLVRTHQAMILLKDIQDAVELVVGMKSFTDNTTA